MGDNRGTQPCNIYYRLHTCIFMLVPVSTSLTTTSMIFVLHNMPLNFQTGSAGSAGEPIQNVYEMLLPSHDMLFPSTAMTPPIHLYKMLHPVQLDLSYDSMKTTKNPYKMLKNLINFITWMMHFTVILVQLPEGPWRI